MTDEYSTDLRARIHELRTRLDEFRTRVVLLEHRVNELDKHSAKRSDIEPLQKIVYGMVSAVMLAVLGGVLALVFNR